MKFKIHATRAKKTSSRNKIAPRYLQDYEQEHKKPCINSKRKMNSSAKNLFFQQVSLDKDPSHYYLNDAKDIQRFALSRNITYVKPKKTQFVEFHNKLKIAPCNLLQTKLNGQALGVYTTKPIWVEPNKTKVIGHYVGELLEDGDEKPGSSFVVELPNRKIIDASEKCNFTAVINGALSEQMSNSKIQTAYTPSGESFVEYYMSGGKNGLYIQGGSQIVGFYGSTDKYDDYQFGKKFITPRDLSLTSKELYKKYNQYDAYHDKPETIDEEFLRLFDIRANTFFTIPKMSQFTDFFDIQYLAYQTHSRKLTLDNLLHQNLQENITPLMFACWRGDINWITRLLTNGANPSIPSSNFGYTAFHTTMLSPINTTLKMQIIDLLSQERRADIPSSTNGKPIVDIIKPNLTKFNDKLCWYCQGDLTAQDKYERTIAHLAVEQADSEMLKFLLDKDVGFWNYQDCNGKDILEAAIINGNISVINFLFTNIRNLKETSLDVFQQIIDYQLCENSTENKITLFSAMECLYNRKSVDFESIRAVYNCIRENFDDVLSAKQKKYMDLAYRQATSKYTSYDSLGLFKVKNLQSSTYSGLSMEISA